LRAAALGYYFATLVFGRAHASELSRELARVEGEQSGPYLAAAIKVGSAVLCRLEGRFTDASRLMRQEIEDLDALGLQTRAAAHHEGLAEIELAAGNWSPLGSARRQRADEPEMPRPRLGSLGRVPRRPWPDRLVPPCPPHHAIPSRTRPISLASRSAC